MALFAARSQRYRSHSGSGWSRHHPYNRPSCLRLSPRDRLVYWRLHGVLTGISLLVGEVLGGLSFLHSRHL